MTNRPVNARRTWGPLLLGSVVTAVLLAVYSIAIAPRFPEDPDRVRFRPIRSFWFADQLRPLFSFEDPETAELLVIGDSRALRAVVAARFEEQGLGETAVLARGGARLVDLIEAAREMPTRRLVVTLTPFSLFERSVRDERGTEPERGELTTQARIDRYLDEHASRLRHNLVRTIDPAVWRRAWLPSPANVKAPIGYSDLMLVEEREQNRAALQRVVDQLAQLRDDGWDLVCVRIPISPELLAVEELGLPSAWITEAVEGAGLRYLDWSARDYPTDDGSHLTGPACEEFSAALAAELARLTGW